MNFDEIETMWRSPHNQPSPAQLQQHQMKFLTDLHRRRRGFVAGMTLIFSVLAFLTVRIVLHLLWPDPADDRIDFTREWALIPLMALPWGAAVLFVRQYRRHLARHPDSVISICDGLRALIDQSKLSVTRAKNMLRLHIIGVPILALCVYQIHTVGKARPHEVVSMMVFFAVVIAVSMGGIAWSLARHRREQRRLESLLAAYD